jgi:hypothetical protein
MTEGPDEMGDTEPRSVFLERAVVGGGAIVAGGVLATGLAPRGATATSPALDRRVLRFLLELEELQKAFYSEARANGKLRGELREFAEVAGADEQAHVALLRKALGRHAPKPPRFDLGRTTADGKTFRETALRLEELAVAAYVGQAGNLSPKLVARAARVVSVDARHAAWIRDIAGVHPAPRAADPGQSAEKVREVRRELGIRRTS